ncbi:MAG: MTH1187 family thiamine-binding protein [Armatimonadetes bacterium]|nr:MTH1187 family thiamine-binding protein [Armatimonadota bacterium]
MALMEIKILPLGTGSTSVSGYVAGSMQVTRESGLKHQLTPMGTVVEGTVDELLALARKIHEVPFEAGAGRVVTVIEIDDRRDKPSTMDSKVESVRRKLA